MPDTFKIGDFAKNLGVTQDLISYYEEQGVLTPEVDEKNHYRRYSFNQTRQIYEAEKYRNLGFSIKEAALLINNDSTSEIEEAFNSKLIELEERERILRYQIEYVKEQRNLYEMRDTFLIVEVGPCYFLPHSTFHDFNANNQEILINWKSKMPLTKMASLVKLPSDPTDIKLWSEAPMYHGLIVKEEIVKEFNLIINEETIYIPKQRAIVVQQRVAHKNFISSNYELINSLLPLRRPDLGIISGDAIRIFEYFSYDKGEHYSTFVDIIPIQENK